MTDEQKEAIEQSRVAFEQLRVTGLDALIDLINTHGTAQAAVEALRRTRKRT